jgi:hypothetical protein
MNLKVDVRFIIIGQMYVRNPATVILIVLTERPDPDGLSLGDVATASRQALV